MNDNSMDNEVNAYAYRYIRGILDCAIRDNDRGRIIDISDKMQNQSVLGMELLLTSAQKKYIISKAEAAKWDLEKRLSYGQLSPLQIPKHIKLCNGTIYTYYIARYLMPLSSSDPLKACCIAKKIRKDIVNNPNLDFKDSWDYLLKRLIPDYK